MVMTSLLTSSQVQMTILGLQAFPDYPCSYYLWRQTFITTLSSPRLTLMSHLTMTSNVSKNSEGLERKHVKQELRRRFPKGLELYRESGAKVKVKFQSEVLLCTYLIIIVGHFPGSGEQTLSKGNVKGNFSDDIWIHWLIIKKNTF